MSKEIVWSPKQLAVFDDIANGTGNTVIRARAGSAKTTTAVAGTERVPFGESICFVAFNKSIANTLVSKVRNGDVRTFHAAGLRGLGRAFHGVDVDADRMQKLCKQYSWGSDWKYRKIVEKIVSLSKSVLAHDAARIDELMDEFGIDLPPEISHSLDARAELIERVLQILEDSKDVRNTIDFDDMVWLPVVLDLHIQQYDRLFVDELQDMAPVQLQLALRMVAPGGRLTAVGDDRQAIYGWRGAQHEAVDWLAQEVDAKILPLTICYRCDRAIIELAQEIVPDIEVGPFAGPGRVAPVGKTTMLEGAQPGDYVLSRSNAPLVGACLGFLQQNKRARIQGRDIGSSLVSFIRNSGMSTVPLFRSYVEKWREEETFRLEQCDPPRNPQNVNDKADTLLVLSDGMPTVESIATRVSGLFSDNGEGQIVCSTIHKAKGLEADRVWTLGQSFAGCHNWVGKQLDAARGLQGTKAWTRAQARAREENNLLYVDITRARHEQLFVEEFPEKMGEE